MRILVASAWAPRLDNGDGLILHHHLTELAGRHEIRAFVAQPAREDDSSFDSVELSSSPEARSAGLDYLARRTRGLLSGEPAHVHWVARPRYRAALAEAITAFQPDVVHLFGWGTAQLAPMAGSIPTTYFAIDPWSQAWGNRIAEGPLAGLRQITDLGERAAVRRHERRHYPHVNAVCFVSHAETMALRSQLPDCRFETIPLGVEIPEQHARATAPLIALHGAFNVQANRVAAIDLVREVLPRVHAAVPSAKVHLIGRDPVPEIRALSSEHVLVIGSVPSMPEALSTCAIEVAPMTVGTGMKNKILEAMAVGLPVVTTSLGLSGIGEGDGALVGDGYDDLARHAVALLTNAALRAEVGAAGRARVGRDFSWQSSARSLEALWEQVLAVR